MSRRPRILVFAHACGPNAGSEPGAGWGVVMALNVFADVVVLTGSARIDQIKAWSQSAPDPQPEFVEVPDGRFARYLRWHRIPHFIQNQLWLRKARREAERLISIGDFDAVNHATFSIYWLPTPATRLDLPSIWGPVGGAVTTPRSLWTLLGRVGVLQELLDMLGVRAMSLLPATRKTALTATVRIVQNEQTRNALAAEIRPTAVLLNHALFNEVSHRPLLEDGRFALWASLMETRKGGRIAIEALAQTSREIRLVMVGDGPQRTRLEALAEELGMSDRIEFTGWIDRSEAIDLMRAATTTIFTGLREEGGLALTEALYSARRVIVLDHGGAGAIARRAIDGTRVALIAPRESNEVVAAFAEAMETHFAAPEITHRPLLSRDAAISELEGAVTQALGKPDPAMEPGMTQQDEK